MKPSTLRVVLAVGIVSLVSVPAAWAGPYIDPNTGGMLFQFLAVLFGLMSGFVLVFYGRLKMVVARISRYVRERRGVSQSPTSPAANQD